MVFEYKRAVYLNWKFVFELKSGKAVYLIWMICIWSQNVYLDPTLNLHLCQMLMKQTAPQCSNHAIAVDHYVRHFTVKKVFITDKADI